MEGLSRISHSSPFLRSGLIILFSHLYAQCAPVRSRRDRGD